MLRNFTPEYELASIALEPGGSKPFCPPSMWRFCALRESYAFRIFMGRNMLCYIILYVLAGLQRKVLLRILL